MKIKIGEQDKISFDKNGVLYVGRPYSEGVIILTRSQARRFGEGLIKWSKKVTSNK